MKLSLGQESLIFSSSNECVKYPGAGTSGHLKNFYSYIISDGLNLTVATCTHRCIERSILSEYSLIMADKYCLCIDFFYKPVFLVDKSNCNATCNGTKDPNETCGGTTNDYYTLTLISDYKKPGILLCAIVVQQQFLFFLL